MARPDVSPAVEFLSVPTPDAWFDHACANLPVLLIDHANCEKKAASTAIGLTWRYVGETRLLHHMSRLAREELRHFEQVLDLMQASGVAYTPLSASRYAQALHALVARDDPERLADLLILGAVVEARSCERFVGLSERLDGPVRDLYASLVHSEARHFQDYLQLAEATGVTELTARVERFLAMDAELVTSFDEQFRFHSGVPVGA